MIITFCGHRDFYSNMKIQQKMINKLLTLAEQTRNLLCYSGGYGNFDRFAAYCVKEAQKQAKNIRNCLVIPYLTKSLQVQDSCYFDEIIYPPLENIPAKYAIIRRNEWMVNQADLLIAYVTHNWGGAARTLQYAKKKDIPILTLYEL